MTDLLQNRMVPVVRGGRYRAVVVLALPASFAGASSIGEKLRGLGFTDVHVYSKDELPADWPADQRSDPGSGFLSKVVYIEATWAESDAAIDRNQSSLVGVHAVWRADVPAAPRPAPPPPPIVQSGNVDQRARLTLLRVWESVTGDPPTLAALQVVQAIGRHEGFYGEASKPPEWKGSHNWGAVQCGHGLPCANDCFEASDSHEDGQRYRACFKRYPSDDAGAADLVRLVTGSRPSVKKWLASGNLDAVAFEMHRTHYHETLPDRYAAALLSNAEAMTKALPEKLVVSRGGLPPELVARAGKKSGAAKASGTGGGVFAVALAAVGLVVIGAVMMRRS
jgi:hypothetical protein